MLLSIFYDNLKAACDKVPGLTNGTTVIFTIDKKKYRIDTTEKAEKFFLKFKGCGYSSEEDTLNESSNGKKTIITPRQNKKREKRNRMKQPGTNKDIKDRLQESKENILQSSSTEETEEGEITEEEGEVNNSMTSADRNGISTKKHEYMTTRAKGKQSKQNLINPEDITKDQQNHPQRSIKKKEKKSRKR